MSKSDVTQRQQELTVTTGDESDEKVVDDVSTLEECEPSQVSHDNFH